MQGLEFRHYFYKCLTQSVSYTSGRVGKYQLQKLYKMTEWMYRTSWKVANESQRPGLIPNFSLER